MKFADLLPQDDIGQLAEVSIDAGNIYRIRMDRSNGIVPKHEGETSRNKFFIVLGRDSAGNHYGGVIVNSAINLHVSAEVRRLHIPILRIHHPFLQYDSYIDCSSIMRVKKASFADWAYQGKVSDQELEIVLKSVVTNPNASKAELRQFGLYPAA